MTSLKFAANISTMFKEVDIFQRFKDAKSNGFYAVEVQDLYSYDFNEIKEAQTAAGVEVILLNSVAESDCGNSGIACNIGKEDDFIKKLHKSRDLAVLLNCHKIHVLAGTPTEKEKSSMNNLEETYLKNLKTAAVILSEHNVMALIEPICKEVKDGYFLNSYEKAVEYINKIGMDNLKLQMDIFHMKMLGIEPKDGIEKYLPYTGHIQISQAPSRHEPFSEGLINYSEVFELLKRKNYTEYIGLEYSPSGSTEESLSWMNTL